MDMLEKLLVPYFLTSLNLRWYWSRGYHWSQVIHNIVNWLIYTSVDTVNSIGVETPTKRVRFVPASPSVDSYSGFTRPLHSVTFISEDGVGFGAIGYEDSLEIVCL